MPIIIAPDAQPLEFWFDFASPYSYLAAATVEERCGSGGVELVWRPFLLGPIFALQGWETSHFNLNPLRGAYMFRDLARTCALHGLPWRKPSAFPRASTLPARVAVAHAEAPWIGDFVRATFRANFAEDRAIGEESVVREILTDLGCDAADVVSYAQAPERKGLLRAQTERAIALGIFGAPNAVVAGELLWGEETVDDAIAWARGRRAEYEAG
jgi:2-hydroxychromene-2-carboxylate isomerase